MQNLQEDSPGRRNAKSQSGIASKRSKGALGGIESGSTALRAENKSDDNNTELYVKRETEGAKLNSESGTASEKPFAHHSELVGVSSHIHEEEQTPFFVKENPSRTRIDPLFQGQ